MGKQEKTEKRIRLSIEQQQEIAKEFIAWIEDGKFDTRDIISFMNNKFSWYAKLVQEKKLNRAQTLLGVIADICGDKLQKLKGCGGGSYAQYIISEEKVKVVKPAKSIKTERFFQVLRETLNSKLGISKQNFAKLMEYTSKNVTVKMLEGVNNEIERLTGMRPFYMDSDHTYVNYDVIQVKADEARLALDEFLERLGFEPEEKELDPSYHDEVKATIKRDYNLVLLFKKTGEVNFKGGDGHRFVREIVGSTTISADLLAEKYQNTLFKRYGTDEFFIGISRKGFKILSEEKLNEALITIEDTFAGLFCEEIAQHTILEESKHDVDGIDTEAMIGIIEASVFGNKSGEMFLKDVWAALDKIGVKRGWNLTGLLRSHPEKFQIKMKNSSGYLEDYVCYTAPAKEPEKFNKEEVEEVEENREEAPLEEPQLTPVREEVKEEEYIDVLATFEDKLDIDLFCRDKLNYREIKKHRDEYVIKIRVDKTDKHQVLSLLKIHYASLRSEKVDLFFEDAFNDVQELESIILI